jgi:hypothetical protein
VEIFILNTTLKLTALALFITSLLAWGGGHNGGTPAEKNITPTFTSVIRATVPENKTDGVYTATASDANNDALTFSISGGADQAAFSINSASGELMLTRAADFEAPSDANTDGVFEVSLAVSDSNGASDQLALNLTVEDVTQLALRVSYPTANANLGGATKFSSVTGFLEDLEDGEVLESDIDSVSVNAQGIDIELPTKQNLAQDGTASWSTQVPVIITPNESALYIGLSDNSNNNQQISRLLLKLR